MKIKMEASSIEQTKNIAKAFAEILKVPTIVLLSGDLGSGKTTFVKFIAENLGCSDLVTSPTFTLLNVYHGDVPIYHFDMYRLSSAEEARDCGFDEYFDKSRLDGIVFVEWAENVEGLINEADYIVDITKKSPTERIFLIMEGKKLD